MSAVFSSMPNPTPTPTPARAATSSRPMRPRERKGWWNSGPSWNPMPGSMSTPVVSASPPGSTSTAPVSNASALDPPAIILDDMIAAPALDPATTAPAWNRSSWPGIA